MAPPTPQPGRRRAIAIAALIAAAAAGFLWLSRTPTSGSAVAKGDPQSASGPANPGPRVAGALETPSARQSTPNGPSNVASPSIREARAELPRIAPGHYDGGLRSLATLFEQHEGPIDRRQNPGPRAKQELEAIRYGMETLDDDIAACLEQWGGYDAADGGEVMIGFDIDRNGLQKSWVQSNVEVPFGPRTCFANAVYGIDWSNIVEQPGEITNRYGLSAKKSRRKLGP